MFDPYRKWLGIAPKDQPPHHYRLLGLDVFESDLDVIEGGVDRAMGFVRQYQSGEHAAVAAKLLNEIATARLCLMKKASKEAYDAKLRAMLPSAESANDQGMTLDFESETMPQPPRLGKAKKKRSRPPQQLGLRVGIGMAIGLFIFGVVFAMNRNATNPQRVAEKSPKVDEPQRRAVQEDSAKKSALAKTKVPVRQLPGDLGGSVVERKANEVKPTLEEATTDESPPTDVGEIDMDVATPKWVEIVPPTLPDDGDFVLFQNVNSGRCLGINSDEAIVQDGTFDDPGLSTQWKVIAVDGAFKVVSLQTRKVLGVPGASTVPGVGLKVVPDVDGATEQMWAIAKGGKHYSLICRRSNLGVAVAYASKVQGAGVCQWPFEDKNAEQVWRIYRMPRKRNDAN